MKHKLLQTWARKSAKLLAAFALLASTSFATLADDSVTLTFSCTQNTGSQISKANASKVDYMFDSDTQSLISSLADPSNLNGGAALNGKKAVRFGSYASGAYKQGTLTINLKASYKIKSIDVTLTTYKSTNSKAPKNPTWNLDINGHQMATTLSSDVTTATTYNIPFVGSAEAAGDVQTLTVKSTDAPVDVYSLTLNLESAGPEPTVAAPEISCADNKVTITCATEGAEIFYTTDGTTTPTAEATKYNAPFLITANTTIKAVAIKDGESSYVNTFVAKYFPIFNGYAEMVAAGVNTTGRVNGPITVIYDNGKNLYTVDNQGYYMLLYSKNEKEVKYNNGDKFSFVEGEFITFNALPEIQNYSIGEVTAGGVAVEPVDKSINDIVESDVNAYIKLQNVNITGVNGADFTFGDGTNTIAGRNTLNIAVEEQNNVDIAGFVCLYQGKDDTAPKIQIVPVTVTANTSVGIAGIEAEDGEAVYFNLQGVCVQNPENGVFIRVQNGKAVKIAK